MNRTPGVVAALILTAVVGLFTWSRTLPVPMAPLPEPAEAPPDAPPLITSFGTAPALPTALSSADFWKMVTEFSEPGGSFIYDNYLSNEHTYQQVIPRLKQTIGPAGVYLGVGPEQNFTYVAATRPQMAFIIDIRRQNMLEMLMYKALFEMAETRADFLSFLFSRRRPAGLHELATAEELFSAYSALTPERGLFEANLRAIKDRLIVRNGFKLAADDEKEIETVYRVFASLGPDLSYSSLSPGPFGPTYEGLMTLTDAEGRNWSYLASEESFRFVRELHRNNMIVPVVGDFAGVKTLRTIARYLKDHNATVSAFYVSNVEMYILAARKWKNFCYNVAALPIQESSRFIRFVLPSYSRYISKGGFPYAMTSVISPIRDVAHGVETGYLPSYYDLLNASE